MLFKIIVSEVAVIHSICGTFMPLLLVLIMTRSLLEKIKLRLEGLSILPFLQFFSALSFTIPYLLAWDFSRLQNFLQLWEVFWD